MFHLWFKIYCQNYHSRSVCLRLWFIKKTRTKRTAGRHGGSFLILSVDGMKPIDYQPALYLVRNAEVPRGQSLCRNISVQKPASSLESLDLNAGNQCHRKITHRLNHQRFWYQTKMRLSFCGLLSLATSVEQTRLKIQSDSIDLVAAKTKKLIADNPFLY